MAEREQVRKPGPQSDQASEEEVPAPKAAGGDLTSKIDDILDEIDEVLETNAEDFVKSYVQKGGE